MNEINWECVRQEAFTTIRLDFGISTLQLIDDNSGNYTPVSGDALARARAARGWERRRIQRGKREVTS